MLYDIACLLLYLYAFSADIVNKPDSRNEKMQGVTLH